MLLWRVKMTIPNLLRLLLLLMLVMRIVLATVCCRFEAEVCYLQFKILLDCLMRTQSHLKRAFTCLVSELLRNPIGYFGTMNSTLGSVVPLAMFYSYRECWDFYSSGKVVIDRSSLTKSLVIQITITNILVFFVSRSFHQCLNVLAW